MLKFDEKQSLIYLLVLYINAKFSPKFGPSQCKMYNVEKANVTEFLERSRTMGANVSLFYNTKTCKEMNGWTYDYRYVLGCVSFSQLIYG